FMPTEKPLIDDLLEKHENEILNTENLIIEIRNGTGGSDNSYQNILPFIYKNPIRIPRTDYLSTPINKQRLYELDRNTGFAIEYGIQTTEEEKVDLMEKYEKLNKHLGEVVNLNAEKTKILELDTVYEFPKQVALLINENNVSTDEQFILEAKQSKKV